jgi:V/A-type H+-transporting ATPase subunit I
MAIVKMKKFTLLAFESHKKALLKELQKFEDVHFKNLQQEDLTDLSFLNQDLSQEAVAHGEAELSKIRFSIQKIEPFVEKPKGLKALTTPGKTLDFEEFDGFIKTYDYESVYEKIKAEDEKINGTKAEITKRKAENETLKAWRKMDVSPTELSKLKFSKHLLGTVNKATAEDFKVTVEEKYKDAYIEFLGDMKDDTVVLILLPQTIYDDAFTFFRTIGFSKLSLGFQGIPGEIMTENERAIAGLQNELDAATENIRALNGELDNLNIAADYYETLLERERACRNFLKMRKVVLIEGWVPAEDTDQFKSIVANVCGNDYHLEEADVEKDSEDVPIKLKNNKFVAAFEDITVMFSLPRYNEIDPTPLIMPFYMLFFGFMLGDAGYGILMLIATAVALKKFHLKPGTRKFIQFFFYLSFPTIFAGIVYGSMFGFPFLLLSTTGPDGLPKPILSSSVDVLTMMILSVVIGVVQILTGIAIKGVMLLRDGKFLDAVFDSLTWIITLLSCIGLLLGATGIAPGIVSTISGWALVISLIVLAATQGRDSPTLGGKIGNGLYAVYGLSGYVGDFVSYTRIAALALSGAYIAYSFNLMAEMLIPDGPIIIPVIKIGLFKIIFGGAIIILGQTLNIALGALGAYVHTCRLQYVEYFGKFYEGGGIPFAAFKLKNKFINIKK